MKNEHGTTLVEYVILVSLIAIVCLGSLKCLGEVSSIRLNQVGNSIGQTTP